MHLCASVCTYLGMSTLTLVYSLRMSKMATSYHRFIMGCHADPERMKQERVGQKSKKVHVEVEAGKLCV